MSTEESAKELIPVPVLVATALGPFVPPMSPLISASSSVPERTIFDKSYPLDSKSSSVPFEKKKNKEDKKFKKKNEIANIKYAIIFHIMVPDPYPSLLVCTISNPKCTNLSDNS